jgi:hypothetical protein
MVGSLLDAHGRSWCGIVPTERQMSPGIGQQVPMVVVNQFEIGCEGLD